MMVFKIVLCVMTLAAAFYFAFRERKLKEQLTDELLEQHYENVSDIDSFYELRIDMRRERILRNLPSGAKSELNIAVGLKILFALVFCFEIFILQR